MDQVDECLQNGKSTIQILKQLRKSISPDEAAQILELHDLRIRARKKFTRAEQLFLTKQQLEQATGEIVAHYKSKRFKHLPSVADLCCGIGGDAIALGRNTNLSIFDSDPIVLKMAVQNLKAYGYSANPILGQAESAAVDNYSAFHIDPDRRANIQKRKPVVRTVMVEKFSPSLEQLRTLEKRNPHFGIKLAPASDVWDGEYEIEFIGHQRECKQQMVWSGDLMASTGITATVISNQGESVESFRADSTASSDPPFATALKKYLFDPHSALVAAKLVPDFACENSMEILCGRSLYLTADEKKESLLANCFEIIDLLKPKLKTIERYLHEQNIGNLEIKKRGAMDTIHQQLSKLRLIGHKSLTIVLTDTPFGFRAIACRRPQNLGER